MNKYNDEFYQHLAQTSGHTATVLVPYLIDWFHPNSVLDVGCGIGSWAAEFKKCGVRRVDGVDGDWVPESKLLIPSEDFRTIDLNQPGSPQIRYDFTVCLEVAEHVTEQAASYLIKYLTDASDVILFSAAIPGQGGTLHVNEQWPDYWIGRFTNHGYTLFDVVRPLLFGINSIDYWYAQNALIFIREKAVIDNVVTKLKELKNWNGCHIVHPRQLEIAIALQRITPQLWLQYGRRQLFKDLLFRLTNGRYPDEIRNRDPRNVSQLSASTTAPSPR